MKVIESFNYKEPAFNLKNLIEELGFTAQVSETLHFNPNMVNNGSQYSYSVMVEMDDLQTIQNKLNFYYKSKAAEVDPDYYLNDFTDTELFEIIENPNSWSKYDFYKAYFLLINREYELNENPDYYLNLAELKFKPIDFSFFQLIFLYTLIFVFGIIPALFGVYVIQTKKSFPSGKKLSLYSEKSLKHARILIIFGILSFIILFIIRFYKAFD